MCVLSKSYCYCLRWEWSERVILFIIDVHSRDTPTHGTRIHPTPHTHALTHHTHTHTLTHSLKGNYYECVEQILKKYPDQVDNLLTLVFSNKIEESKVQSLLEYLSKTSVHLLTAVLSKLANNTCTAGMELLR